MKHKTLVISAAIIAGVLIGIFAAPVISGDNVYEQVRKFTDVLNTASKNYVENNIVFYYYSLFRATSPSINVTPNRVYYPSWDSYFYDTSYDGYFPHGYWRNYPIVLDSPTAWEIYPSTFNNALPTDTNSWVEGDNRNHQIKQVLIDIALYHFHSRISPSNIPQLRRMRYNGDGDPEKTSAIKWLTDVAHGILNADLPEKVVPQYINRIRSEPKKVNMY